MSALVYRSLTELAGLIQDGEASSEEVVRAHFSHIHRHNETLNALVLLNEEEALARAIEADAARSRGEHWGVLHGVPVTIKDSLETAGITTTSSHAPLKDYVPSQNATVVQRLLDAGAIILGKTNLPELAMQVQTNGRLHGTANNPWDLSRTPGGSTGGGAAALAAGLTPLEMGSDLAGSIRIPAHFCGVVGHKPTVNLVSGAGHIPPLPGQPLAIPGVAVIGPLARTVDDLMLTMRLIYGPDGRDWDVPPVELDAESAGSLSHLRIAWCDDFGGVPVTKDTKEGLRRLADTLSDQGCQVEEATPPSFDFEDIGKVYGRIVGAGIAVNLPTLERLMGYYVGPLIYRKESGYSRFLKGFGLDMRLCAKATQQKEKYIRILDAFLADWDVWLCPVSSTPAILHQADPGKKPYKPISVDGTSVPYYEAITSHTTVLSILGNPVTVIPLTQSKNGLPIGVQVIGKRWKDMRTLAIAKLILGAIGTVRRPPGFEVL